MIYTSDLQQLVSAWKERATSAAQPTSYKDALNECIYDLDQLVDNSIIEEIDYQDMVDSWEADTYLSSMEAHEA